MWNKPLPNLVSFLIREIGHLQTWIDSTGEIRPKFREDLKHGRFYIVVRVARVLPMKYHMVRRNLIKNNPPVRVPHPWHMSSRQSDERPLADTAAAAAPSY